MTSGLTNTDLQFLLWVNDRLTELAVEAERQHALFELAVADYRSKLEASIADGTLEPNWREFDQPAFTHDAAENHLAFLDSVRDVSSQAIEYLAEVGRLQPGGQPS